MKIVSVYCHTGSTFGVKVSQSPPILFMKIRTKSVTLNCQHDDSTHYNMFWYRQQTNRELKMIAYSSGKDNAQIEKPFEKSKYTLTRPEVLKSSLEIKDLESGDSALYFCATSIAQWNSSASQQHNNLIIAERDDTISHLLIYSALSHQSNTCFYSAVRVQTG